MTTPNVDMVTALLRSCSLGRGRRDPTPPPPPQHQQLVEASAEVAVELNSEIPLPYHWEQYLDMRTGEVYYVNWETGIRTTDDPRSSAAATRQLSSYSDEDEVSDEDSGSSYDDSGDTAGSDCLSSASSPETLALADFGGGSSSQVLVAAGCNACFTYFMVPKHVESCLRCGGRLLHLGANGFI